MISSKHKIVFVHIPKCAGTTIIKSFQKQWDSDIDDHQTMDELSLYLNENEDYFKFVVIRNPWERIASLYSYFEIQKSKRVFKDLKDKYQTDTFEKFVLKLPILKQLYKPKTTFMSMSEYIGNHNYNMIIDTSELDSKMFDIYTKFNKELRNKVRRFNVSENTMKHMQSYTPEMIEMVAKVYKDDIERFNYKFPKND